MIDRAKREAEEKQFPRTGGAAAAAHAERYQQEARLKQLQGEFGRRGRAHPQGVRGTGLPLGRRSSCCTSFRCCRWPGPTADFGEGKGEDRRRRPRSADRPWQAGSRTAQEAARTAPTTDADVQRGTAAILLIDRPSPKNVAPDERQPRALCSEVAEASGGFLGLGARCPLPERATSNARRKEIADLHPESGTGSSGQRLNRSEAP